MILSRIRLLVLGATCYDVWERGPRTEPRPFLHNDLLAYNCRLVNYPHVAFSPGERERDRTAYLTALNHLSLYITPAGATTFQHGERFVEFDVRGDTVGRVQPRVARVVEAGAQFEAYVLSERPVLPGAVGTRAYPQVPPRLALEWWRPLPAAPLIAVEGEELPLRRGNGAYRASGPLNVRDAPPGAIVRARYVEITRARLACDAQCVGAHYKVRPGFGIPAGMRFQVEPDLLPGADTGYDLSRE